MIEIYYEKFLSIDTKRAETRMDSCKLYNRYEPTPYEVLEKLLDSYEISDQDHIVDFGSGKGRVAFFLNCFTGAGVTGVELVTEFHDKSISNYKSYKACQTKKSNLFDGLKAKKNADKTKIFFVNDYAERYAISRFENKFFFFNPFNKMIFINVVNNIIGSYEEFKRPIDIIMYYPSMDFIDYLEDKTVFNHMMDIDTSGDQFTSNNFREKISIYRIGDMDLETLGSCISPKLTSKQTYIKMKK